MNLNALDFSERMAAGREQAMVNRNLGRHVGASGKGWNNTRQPNHYGDRDSWEWLCSEARREYRRECAEIRNDYAVTCLNYECEPQNRLKSTYDLTDTF